MLALKDLCLHPTTNMPYVKMAMGGKDNSPEDLSVRSFQWGVQWFQLTRHQGGITHAFISEFESEEDRKYYLKEDPAHLAFVKSLGAVMKKAQVIDFTPGIF